jgi:glutamine synthetase
MVLRPDPKSAFVDPFFDDPTLSVFCDVIDPRTHGVYSRDSRGLAQRAQQLIRSLGIADVAYLDPNPNSSYSTTSASIRQRSTAFTM